MLCQFYKLLIPEFNPEIGYYPLNTIRLSNDGAPGSQNFYCNTDEALSIIIR